MNSKHVIALMEIIHKMETIRGWTDHEKETIQSFLEFVKMFLNIIPKGYIFESVSETPNREIEKVGDTYYQSVDLLLRKNPIFNKEINIKEMPSKEEMLVLGKNNFNGECIVPKKGENPYYLNFYRMVWMILDRIKKIEEFNQERSKNEILSK